MQRRLVKLARAAIAAALTSACAVGVKSRAGGPEPGPPAVAQASHTSRAAASDRVHAALDVARTRGVAWPRVETTTVLAGAAGELRVVAEKSPAPGSVPLLCDLSVPGRVLLDPVFVAHERADVSGAGALACLVGEGERNEVATVPFFSKRHTEVELAPSAGAAASCLGARLQGREEHEGLALHAASTFRVRWWRAGGARWPGRADAARELVDELAVLDEEVRRDPRPEVLELRAARQVETALAEGEPARSTRLALARGDLERAGRLVPLALVTDLTSDRARWRAAVEGASAQADADAEAWYMRGQLLERAARGGLDGADLRDVWRAADAYQRAMELDGAGSVGQPPHPFYRLGLGRVLVQAHRHRAAVRELVALAVWLEQGGLATRYPEVLERAAQLAGTAFTYRDFDGPPAGDPARVVDVLDQEPDPKVQDRVLAAAVKRMRDPAVLPDGLLAPRAVYWALHELATLQLAGAAEVAARIFEERWPTHADAPAVQRILATARATASASSRR